MKIVAEGTGHFRDYHITPVAWNEPAPFSNRRFVRSPPFITHMGGRTDHPVRFLALSRDDNRMLIGQHIIPAPDGMAVSAEAHGGYATSRRRYFASNCFGVSDRRALIFTCPNSCSSSPP